MKNSQTPRRSADRKAGHVLRFASCCFYDASPVGMKTAAPELTHALGSQRRVSHIFCRAEKSV